MEREPSVARGLAHPAHPAVIGANIGIVGGSVFMLLNGVQLPQPWPTVALAAWIVLAAAAVWAVFLAPRRMRDAGAPSRGAGLIYAASVVGMLALMAVGTRLAAAAGLEGASPAVVVTAVGLHFIPFAWAFRSPVFAWLGGTMTALGVAGVLAAAALGSAAGAAAAVLAGAVMLGFLAVDARRS